MDSQKVPFVPIESLLFMTLQHVITPIFEWFFLSKVMNIVVNWTLIGTSVV